MLGITDADRKAADELRLVLADICGFWHRGGDDSPLCAALSRHRIEAEQRLMEKLSPIIAMPADTVMRSRTDARCAKAAAPRRDVRTPSPGEAAPL